MNEKNYENKREAQNLLRTQQKSKKEIKINRMWALTKKNISLYIKKGPVITFGLLFPFFITVSWVIGRSLTPEQIFVGIVSMTAFFTATAISPVIIPIETREKSLERILSAPLTISDIILGIVIGSTLYSIIISITISFTFLLILGIPFPGFSGLIVILLSLVLMAILGSVLGALVSAYPTDMTSNVMIIMNLIKFPLLFISGIFIPIEKMPETTRLIALLSPITFLVDLLRGSLNSSNYFSYSFDFLMLILWIIVLYIITLKIHDKTLQKRISLGGKRPPRQ